MKRHLRFKKTHRKSSLVFPSLGSTLQSSGISWNETVSRRRFLKAAALTSSYALLWGWRDIVSAKQKGSAIVIGAGMSGIAAARELKSRGFHVTVLEGRGRIGGRIWSNKTLGATIDLGASWIHGTEENPMTALAKKIGVKMKITDFDDVEMYDFDGKEVSEEDAEDFEDFTEELMGKVEALSENLENDISYGDAIQKAIGKQKPPAKMQRFLNAQIAGMESESGADIDSLSIFSNEDEGFDGEDVLFPGGYVQLVQYLAKGLDIHFQTTVKAVDYSGSKVKILTNKKSYEADYAVVTVPLGVLKGDNITQIPLPCGGACHTNGKNAVDVAKIKFIPELPDAKKKAIGRLGFGVLNKVALKFPVDAEDFPSESHFVSYAAKTRSNYMEFLNMNKYGVGPILIAFTGGNFARSMEAQTDSDVVKDVMKVLRTIYANEIPNPSGHVIARWMKDPFAGGAYSYVRVGSKWSDYDAIMQPLKNRVFFAGEATIKEFPGTVHGAFLSGVREAKRIAKL